MDNDIHERRKDDNSLAILDAMRQWVAEPLERHMASLEAQIRDQQVATSEHLKAMREDFKAAITTMADPQTGYIPRSETMLLFSRMDDRFDTFVKAVEQREQDRKINIRWLIGSTLTVATLVATIVSAIATLLPRPHP